MDIKDIIKKERPRGMSSMLKEIVSDIWREEGEKLTENILRSALADFTRQLQGVVREVRQMQKGETGPEPTNARLLSLILPRMPKDGEPGKTPSKKEIQTLIRALLPREKNIKEWTAEEIKSLARMIVPKPVSHDAQLGKMEENFREQIQNVYKALNQRNKEGKMLHGGGMRIKDSATVTVTRNSDGTYALTASASVGNQIWGETPTGSGTSFLLAHTPQSGTLRLYRGGARQQAGMGNDYTLTGATITLAVTPEPAEILLADYSYA